MGYGVLGTRLLNFYVGSNSAQDLPEVGHGESIRLIFVTGNKPWSTIWWSDFDKIINAQFIRSGFASLCSFFFFLFVKHCKAIFDGIFFKKVSEKYNQVFLKSGSTVTFGEK